MARQPAKASLFKRHARADERRRSALALVEAIAPLDIDEPMKKRMLSHCLWYVTETEGTSKYRTRYMSEAAIGKSAKLLHHEHVIPRKILVEEMIRNPDRASEIAATAIGCTVTRKEHAVLSAQDKTRSELSGWERYRLAGVQVRDTATGAPVA